MSEKVRSRFAPSPTGYMHLGNLRTAIYEYLIARAGGGDFILRIEDTDLERFVPGSLEVIYETLRTVGLEYDEGPDIGGPFGPYVQSQRKDIYLDHAKKLIGLGGAYYCFCSKERLDSLRQEAEKKGETFRYDGHCRGISRDTAEGRVRDGEPHVVRQAIPSGTTTVRDELYGQVTVDNAQLDDNVLLKSDGLPTYNFANVVDDHLMRISHVVRGSEYISSAPKYNILYQAFGWDIPRYVHLPLIMKDHSRKLGKRYGDPSFQDLLAAGFLKEAVVNYIVLLGWNPKGNREFFTLDELKQCFTISGLGTAPAIFDIEKLRWMNGEYIRRASPEAFYELARPYFQKAVKRTDIDLHRLAELVRPRTIVMADIPGLCEFIDTLPDYDIALYANKKMKTDAAVSLESLRQALPGLEALQTWDHDSVHNALFALIERLGLKTGQMLWPVRTALSGRESSPGGAIDLAAILGRDETLKRIKTGIDKLTG